MHYEELRNRVITCLLDAKVPAFHTSKQGRGFGIVNLDSPSIPKLEEHHKIPLRSSVLVKALGYGRLEMDETVSYWSILDLHGFSANILVLPIQGKDEVRHYIHVTSYSYIRRRRRF